MGGGRRRRRGWRRRFGGLAGREQGGGFDQAAEVLLAGLVMRAFAGGEVQAHLVSDFEPFEADDADEFIAFAPDLALSKLQGHVRLDGKGKSPSLRASSSRKDGLGGRLLFLAGGLLAGHDRFFRGGGFGGGGLFLAGLLLVGFWGFIAHNFFLLLLVVWLSG